MEAILFWMVLFFAFAIIEFIAPGLSYAASFAVSALLTTGVAYLFPTFWVLQAIAFIVASILSLYVFKKTVYKIMAHDNTKSNVHRLIRSSAKVIARVDETTYSIKVGGEIWRATLCSSASRQELKIDQMVCITSIQGCTAYVKPLSQE